MSDEISEAFKLAYTRLAANATLQGIVGTKIYAEEAPPGTTGLFILGDYAAGSDFNGLGTARLQTEAEMLWRLVKKGQPDAQMKAANVAMDAELQELSAVTSGGYVLSARRVRPYRRAYFDSANVRHSEVGGFYRFYISQAA